MNNPYTYPEVPYQGTEVKDETVDSSSIPSAPGAYAATSDPPSLPSIASLLSEGQSNSESAKQGSSHTPSHTAQTSNQSTPRIPQPSAQSAEAVTPQPVSVPQQTSLNGESLRSHAQISQPIVSQQGPIEGLHPSQRAQSVSPPIPERHQGAPHAHQQASTQPIPQVVPQLAHQLPPQGSPQVAHGQHGTQGMARVAQIPPHIQQQMQQQASIHASPRGGVAQPTPMEHGHHHHQQDVVQMQQATRSPAPYVMQQQVQMGNSPQVPGGYIMPPQGHPQGHPQGSQAPHPASQHSHSHVVPTGNMVNNGHPYMMQNQYWQKPPMHPMYPVMSASGMQPMAPVMQYYPTAAGPYRTGHRNLSMGQEIKRRTKTGCLTCRRRRIKCDEQHPMCKNCSKSERICLGYDPILMSFSTDKNARLKQLQIKRRRFAQRQKYEKMRVASLVESTPPDAPHTWEQVVELFRFITPQLDELFETRQFSAIAQHVAQQLKHQGESKIVGELEVIRQLVTIVFSDRNFDGLNVLDFPGANLEKLRTTNDYTLVRCLVEALTLSDSSLHAAQIADERIQGKVMLMKQVIFAKEIHTASPVSAAEIVHSAVNAVSNPQQSWITISDLLTRGGQEIQVPHQVGPLGTLVIASAGEHSAQQLLQQDLDPFSRALLELSLDPP